jgi:hypothetical protein
MAHGTGIRMIRCDGGFVTAWTEQELKTKMRV